MPRKDRTRKRMIALTTRKIASSNSSYIASSLEFDSEVMQHEGDESHLCQQQEKEDDTQADIFSRKKLFTHLLQ